MAQHRQVRRSTHGAASACLPTPPPASPCLSSGWPEIEVLDPDSRSYGPESTVDSLLAESLGALLRNEGAVGSNPITSTTGNMTRTARQRCCRAVLRSGEGFLGGLVEGSGHRWPVLGTWLASWVGWWRDPATGGRFLALRQPSIAVGAVGAAAGAVGAAASTAPRHCQHGAGSPPARRGVTASSAAGHRQLGAEPGLATHDRSRWRMWVLRSGVGYPTRAAVNWRRSAARAGGPGRHGPRVQRCVPRRAGRRPSGDRPAAVRVLPASSRRSAAPPIRRSADPQIRRSADPPLRRSAAPPLRRSAAPPIRRSAAPPLRPSADPPLHPYPGRSVQQPVQHDRPLPCATVGRPGGSCVLVRGPYGDLRAAADDTWQARCVGTRGADSEVGRRWTRRSWWSRTTPRSVS